MNTKSTMQAVLTLGIAFFLSFMSFNVLAERKGMMSDEEMEKMMRERSSEDMPMMGRGMMMDGMGHGMGSGMMGGMGSGMMGGMGHGMGCGMMGGMGSGMMMGRMANMLDINDKQRASMRKIAGDLRRSNWPLLSQIMDARDQLAELYDKDKLDAKAIGKVYGQIFDIKQQMIEAGIDAHNKCSGLLSKEQKERVEHMRGK